MSQLVKVVKTFADGTETVHEFRPNPHAEEIEAAVRASQEALQPTEVSSEVSASEVVSEVDEASSSEEAPKKRKKKVESEE